MAVSTKRVRCNTQWCSAINCSNNRRNNPSLSFFRFPKDLERCKKWIVNVRRQDLDTKSPEQLYKNNILCANHFELSQFMNPMKNKLIHCAVPTLFDVPNKPQNVTPSRPPPKKRRIVELDQSSKPAPPMLEAPKKDKASTSKSLSPKKVVLHKKLHASRQQLYRLRNKNKSEINKKVSLTEIKEILADHLKDNTLEFIMTQIKVASKSKHALRWSEANKSLALSFYHSSPKTYKLLQQLLKLPSVRTLKRSMSNLNLKPGFCTNILQALKVKVNSMTSNEKLCTLVFDELAIKEAVIYNKKHDVVQGFEDFGFSGRSRYIANHACVFMVRGLTANWKQPFGFVFSSGPIKAALLKDLLLQAISELESVGLCVKAVICDQGSNTSDVA